MIWQLPCSSGSEHRRSAAPSIGVKSGVPSTSTAVVPIFPIQASPGYGSNSDEYASSGDEGYVPPRVASRYIFNTFNRIETSEEEDLGASEDEY
jgi:hypothetical protein